MSETDPFTDPAFTSRLQKLLSMLGSEQPGEADAARRKIGEHLAHHRLSFTDLAQHVRDTPGHPMASFTQGAREMSLERQLAIARAAKEEAAYEAEAALNRVRMLEMELQQATFDIAHTLNSQARIRIAAAVACVIAVGCLIVVILPHTPAIGTAGPTIRPDDGQVSLQTRDPHGDPTVQMITGEIAGRAAVQDLAIRLMPNDQAGIRAFLNRGEKVVVQKEMQVGPQTWLLIRSATGSGYVRAGDVLR